MPKMNARRCITESPHRRMEVQPYYASQRRFTLANGWLVPGNLGGIADRLLLAGHGRSVGAAFRQRTTRRRTFRFGKREYPAVFTCRRMTLGPETRSNLLRSTN
jgi:hypothetical protein